MRQSFAFARTRKAGGLAGAMVAAIVSTFAGLPAICQSEAAPPAEIRVAFGSFSCDDDFIRSRIALRNIEAALQASLGSMPGVQWVERQETGILEQEIASPISGLTGGASALRAGKWLKADFLVLGRFSRLPGTGHELALEIVEVDHADVLARRRLDVPGDSRDPVAMGAAYIAMAAAEIQSAISEARLKRSSQAGAIVVAPLFFQNIDPSPRLNRVEPQIQSLFAELGDQIPGVRVVRFPRALDASPEAELGLRGLAESDPDAWRKAADTYIWGTIRELPSDGITFEQTPVEITINVWNGAGEPAALTSTPVVANIETAARELVAQALLHASANAGDRPPLDRAEVAGWFRTRTRTLAATIREMNSLGTGFLQSNEGRARQRQLISNLEVACFFSPEDCTLRVQRLVAVWPGFPYSPGSMLEHMRLAEELDSLTDQCGRDSRRIAGRDLLGDCARSWESLQDYLRNPRLVPIDATDALVQEWRTLAERRLKRNATRTPQAAALVPAPESNRGGPALPGVPPRAPDAQFSSGAIRWPARPPEPDALRMVRFDPLLRRVSILPGTQATVTALAHVDRAIWVAIEAPAAAVARTSNQPQPGGNANRPLLVRWEPSQNIVESLADRLSIGSRITAILPHEKMLWIATANDGVLRVDPYTLESRRFSTDDGLLTPNLDAMSGGAGRVYFVGDRSGVGLVSIFNSETEAWSRLKSTLPGTVAGSPVSPAAPRLLLAYEHWLLSGSNPLVLIDLETGHAEPLNSALGMTDMRGVSTRAVHGQTPPPELEPFLPRGRPFRRWVVAMAASERGLWLATNWELIFLDPRTLQSVTYPAPFSPGAGMSVDGDYIWLKSAAAVPFPPTIQARISTSRIGLGPEDPAERSQVLLFHIPTGRWLGAFPVPGPVEHLLATRTHLYIGLRTMDACLIEADKALLLGQLGAKTGESLQRVQGPPR